MAREFEETVRAIAERIGRGRVLLSERVRAGRRRAISVGPYRTATAPRRWGVIVTPPPTGEHDLRVYGSPDRAAREFVRIVGVSEARDALARDARKQLG